MLTQQWPELTHGAGVLEESAVRIEAAPAEGAPGAVSRRTVLAASATAVSAVLPLLLTGCKGVQALGTPPPPAPDIVALRTAISAEELMLARYAAFVAPTSGSSGDALVVAAVKTVQLEHVAHLAQLKSRLVEPAGSSPSATPSPSLSSTAPVPGATAAALAGLEQAEQAASDRLIRQLGGLPPSLAQLFASIAASEATHVPYLRALRRDR
jgi:hypothetical protein